MHPLLLAMSFLRKYPEECADEGREGDLSSYGCSMGGTRKSKAIFADIWAVIVTGRFASSAIAATRPLKLFAQIGPIIGIKPVIRTSRESG
jgi:hypothetical protein